MSPGSVAPPAGVRTAVAGVGTPGDSKTGSRSRPSRITLFTRGAARCSALGASSGARAGGDGGASQAVNVNKPEKTRAGSDRRRPETNLIAVSLGSAARRRARMGGPEELLSLPAAAREAAVREVGEWQRRGGVPCSQQAPRGVA